jgi:predicted nucleic acid-binding protein
LIRAFLDASVLFAASYSRSGYARDLIRAALRGQLVLVVNDFVLEEVRRNLGAKAPEALDALETALSIIPFEIAPPPAREAVQRAAAYIALKDAPVIAAAQEAGVDYLVTFDRRHFLDDPQVSQRSGVEIALPEQLVQILRQSTRVD